MTRIPNVFLAAAVAVAASSLVAPSSAFGVSPPLRMMGVAVGNFAAPSKTTTALNLEDNIAEMYVLFPIFLFFFFLFFFRRLLFPPPCPCRYPTFFLLGSIFPARPSLTLPPPPCENSEPPPPPSSPSDSLPPSPIPSKNLTGSTRSSTAFSITTNTRGPRARRCTPSSRQLSIASSISTQSPSLTSLIRPVRGPGTRRWLSTIP